MFGVHFLSVCESPFPRGQVSRTHTFFPINVPRSAIFISTSLPEANLTLWDTNSSSDPRFHEGRPLISGVFMIGQTRYTLVSHPKKKFRAISLPIKYQRKLVLMKMGNGEEADLMPAALVTAGLEPFPPIGALSHLPIP